MHDFRERVGPLWIRISGTELAWSLAAAFSWGVLLGITVALMATAKGGAS